ncbi:MAG: AmmeMemoRadiSam system protein A [Propionibacteriaceae bacterium]|nr:AmmeMemoRadiSam system protein A [Propionibacteriaceae bacterium]
MSDFPDGAGKVLTGLARASIAKALRLTFEVPTSTNDAWLDAPGAAFVTLTQNAQLRGCIGSLVAHRALRDDVTSNARAAAFDDPRFMPLAADELVHTRIEVSVLSAPAPMPFASRQGALAQLRPGIDGVILGAGGRRATFLPQVWDELPEPEVFIAHLFRKAGLPPNYWGDDVTISRYTVTAFLEDDPT